MIDTVLDTPDTHSAAVHQTRRAPISFAAGIGYSIAWLAGLLVFSSSTQVRSTGAQVLRAYAGHQGVVSIQFVLTEGVAAVMLAVVTWSLAAAVARRAGALKRLILTSGLVASGVSIVQCGLGLWLTTTLLSERDANTAGAVAQALNRLDGVKMLLLAVLAAGTATAVYRSLIRLPRWLGAIAVAVAVTITLSAVGYLLLNNLFATAAWLSLPLLLVFVTGTGISLDCIQRHDTEGSAMAHSGAVSNVR
ncbi:MAG: hypothetical protein M3Y58_14255 [Chloroflexota bacterium]|nr:hypothetical protein [Chloroflexota bacterium]